MPVIISVTIIIFDYHLDADRGTGVNATNYKTSPDRMSWMKGENNMLHTLANKPTFENMTVEEICDEIRNIRKSELTKNKLNTWSGDDATSGTDKLGGWDEKTGQGGEKIKSDAKEENEDTPSTPPPPPVTTEKVKRPSPVPKSSLTKPSPKSSPVPPGKKKSEVKRSTSFRSNKSFKRVSENARNKLNHGKKHAEKVFSFFVVTRFIKSNLPVVEYSNSWTGL